MSRKKQSSTGLHRGREKGNRAGEDRRRESFPSLAGAIGKVLIRNANHGVSEHQLGRSGVTLVTMGRVED